ncbi:MAG: maltotransferase domain-containing protein, partial [Candidatus Hermodarchaeota archaeon]
QEVSVELLTGAQLIVEASQRAVRSDRRKMGEWASILQSTQTTEQARVQLALGEELSEFMDKYPDKRFASTYAKELVALVDREKAR